MHTLGRHDGRDGDGRHMCSVERARLEFVDALLQQRKLLDLFRQLRCISLSALHSGVRMREEVTHLVTADEARRASDDKQERLAGFS